MAHAAESQGFATPVLLQALACPDASVYMQSSWQHKTNSIYAKRDQKSICSSLIPGWTGAMLPGINALVLAPLCQSTLTNVSRVNVQGCKAMEIDVAIPESRGQYVRSIFILPLCKGRGVCPTPETCRGHSNTEQGNEGCGDWSTSRLQEYQTMKSWDGAPGLSQVSPHHALLSATLGLWHTSLEPVRAGLYLKDIYPSQWGTKTRRLSLLSHWPSVHRPRH